MRRQESMVQMKEQGKKKKKTQDQINKEEIGSLPEKNSEKW